MKRASLAVLGLYFLAAGAAAQDVSQGALLYDAHCLSCHREGLHDRRNSKVKSYADLRLEVERWTRQTGRSFTSAEIEELIDYLDRAHYRLDLPRPPAPARR